MNILTTFALFLIGWILIIIIRAITINKISAFDSEEMVKDGNNLFSTGLLYALGNVACYFIHIKLIAWILFIAGTIMAIIPTISALSLITDKRTPASRKFTAILAQVIPLIMAINILIVYIM